MLRIICSLLLLVFIISCSPDRGEKALILMDRDELFKSETLKKLIDAIERNEVHVIESLIKSGQNVNEVGERNASGLYWALIHDKFESFKILLELGADPNQELNCKKENPACTYFSIMGYAILLERKKYWLKLFQYGANPDYINGNDEILLKVAMRNDDAFYITSLLEAGANPNITTSRNPRLLTYYAVLFRKYDYFFKLINYDALIRPVDLNAYKTIEVLIEEQIASRISQNLPVDNKLIKVKKYINNH